MYNQRGVDFLSHLWVVDALMNIDRKLPVH